MLGNFKRKKRKKETFLNMQLNKQRKTLSQGTCPPIFLFSFCNSKKKPFSKHFHPFSIFNSSRCFFVFFCILQRKKEQTPFSKCFSILPVFNVTQLSFFTFKKKNDPPFLKMLVNIFPCCIMFFVFLQLKKTPLSKPRWTKNHPFSKCFSTFFNLQFKYCTVILILFLSCNPTREKYCTLSQNNFQALPSPSWPPFFSLSSLELKEKLKQSH